MDAEAELPGTQPERYMVRSTRIPILPWRSSKSDSAIWPFMPSWREERPPPASNWRSLLMRCPSDLDKGQLRKVERPSVGLRGVSLFVNRLERERGFEPPTLCLGSRCSTPELLPLAGGRWATFRLSRRLPGPMADRWASSSIGAHKTPNKAHYTVTANASTRLHVSRGERRCTTARWECSGRAGCCGICRRLRR